MSEETIHILLIEDNPGDAYFIREVLDDVAIADPEAPKFHLTHTERLSDSLARLAEGGFDIVLLDLSLLDSQGLETFAAVHAGAPETPIIVLSGLEDKSLAVEAVRGGAQDYLVKGQASGSLLVRAMRYAIERARTETLRRQTEEVLRQTELRFRSLVQQTTDAVFCYEYDPPIPIDLPVEEQVRLFYEGVLVECNDAAARSYGAARAEEVIGKKLTELFGTAPSSLDGFFKTFIQNGYQVVDLEGAEVLDDGTERYYSNNGHGVVENGVLLRVWGTFRDITDRKRAEKTLRESEERLKLALEAADEGLFDWNMQTGEAYFSPRYYTLLGYKPNEMPASYETWIGLLHPDDKESAANTINEYAEGKRDDHEIEYRMKTKSGEWRWVLSRGRVTERDANGQPVRMVGTHIDITERKRAEEALQYRVTFERLITGISTHFINLAPQEVDSGIDYALEAIGQFANVDRSYVFQFRDDGATMDNTHEWCVEGIEPQIQQLQEIPMDPFHWSLERIKRLEDIHVPRVVDLPPEASAEKEEFQAEGIQSLVMTPMVYGGTAIGFLGFDSIRAEKTWPEDLIVLLRITGNIFANALEHKRVQEALRRREQEFKTLVENNPDMVARFDRECRHIYANPAVKRELGITPELLLGKTHRELGRLDEQADWSEGVIRQVFQAGQELTFETVIETPTGTKHYTSRGVPELAEDGTVASALLIHRDITERKKAEGALQESEHKFRSIVETSPLGMHMYQLEPDGRLVFAGANPAADHILGVDNSQFVGKTIEEAFPALTETEVPTQYRRVAVEGGTWHTDQVIYEEGDVTGAYEVHAFQTSPGRMVATFLDVTERRQAAEALHRERDLVSHIMETSPAGIVMVDREGQVTFANPRAEQVLGLTKDEATQRTYNDPAWHITDYDGGPFPEEALPFQRVMRTGQPAFDVRHAIEWPDGRRVLLSINAAPLLSEAGEADGMVATVEDITEQVQAEYMLRQQNAFRRSVIEKAMEGLCVCHSVPEHPYVAFTVWNNRMAEITGYTMEEINRLGWYQTMYPDPEIQQQAIARMERMRQRDDLVREEWVVTRADGEKRTILISTAVLEADGGQEHVLAMMEDVTERKRAEEALRESEATMRSIFRAAPVGIGMVSERVLLQANDRLCEMTGYSREELLGQNARMLYPTDEEYEYVGREKYAQIRERGTGTVETRLRCKDGAVIDVLLSSTPIDPSDLAAGVTFTALDITGRKQAEEAIRKSQESLARAQSIAHLGGWEWHMIAQETIWSDENFHLFGHEPGDLEPSFDKFIETVHPDDRDMIMQKLGDIQAGKITEDTYEYRIILPNGTERWLEGQLSVVFSDDGQPAALVGTNLDITERKQAEVERERLLAQVQEQAQRIQHIVDTVPEGVLLLDTDHRILLANPAAEKLLTALADARAGDTLTHLADCPIEQFLTSPPQGLWHELATNGSAFEAIARPIEDGSSPRGWVLVVRDVTQQREVERRVQQQERLAAVGQLAAGIAHDFNNIMAVITLYADMSLRTPDLPPKVYDRLQTIDQQAHRASDLIQQILDFSRRAVLERGPLDLVLFLKEQIRLLQRTLPESITINLAYGADEYVVHADPTRIQQAVMNLATNARDAMPDGGPLRFSLDHVRFDDPNALPIPDMTPGDWVRLSVTDSGTGIPPDVLPRIFDPFFTTKPPGQGAGLGLSQVYGILRQHDGFVDVDTHLEEGTTFILYLPALSVEQPPAYIPTQAPLPQGHGETILVVEDDVTTRAAVVGGLETLGYHVLQATTGQEALATFSQRQSQIALVLSDMVMPKMGGQALFQALREQVPHVKVVLMSGHPLNETEVENLRAQGLSGWLAKPPSLEQLADVITRALRKG